MNQHLKQLIELAEIDNEIDAFEPQIEEANYKYEAILAKKKSIDRDIENLAKEIEEEEQKKRKNELHIVELSAKLEELNKKSADVKTEREMKSLQLEEEIAKEQIAFANEEIARLEKIIEAKKQQIEASKENLQNIQKQLEDVKEEVEKELQEIDKKREEIFKRKETLLSTINQKGIAFYQKIRRWAKNTTVVPIEDRACMGCHMIISEKVYADVIKGEEIVNCPHCGRILYIKPEEKEQNES
jgi:predicted  nucleic acid-binding Zn-ribbon protein